MELHRHPCGLIYTREFAEFLGTKHAQEVTRHADEVLSMEYVRCVEGEKAGTAWWQLVWVPSVLAPKEHRYRIGETEVYIHRQTRRGLLNRLLHFADEQVQVKR